MRSHRSPLRKLAVLAGALAAGALFLACDDVVNDPTFRLWCGDALCSWQTDAGRIKRVPTWHEDDFGVSFEETPTRISQKLQRTPKCMLLTAVANVEPTAQMTVDLDFDGDGKADASYPLPQAAWRETKTLISAPDVYGPVATITLHKRGTGTAILAELRVQARDSCDRSSVPAAKDLRVGLSCTAADQCGTGICCAGICAECCPAPSGWGASVGNKASPCESDRCAVRADACSAANGFGTLGLPFQCDPGKGLGKPGAVCTQNEDCASKSCDGAIARTAAATTPDGGVVCTTDGGGASQRVTSVIAGTCR